MENHRNLALFGRIEVTLLHGSLMESGWRYPSVVRMERDFGRNNGNTSSPVKYVIPKSLKKMMTRLETFSWWAILSCPVLSSLVLQRVQKAVKRSWGGFAIPVRITKTASERFIFRFKTQEVIDSMQIKGPWTFDGVILGLQQVSNNQAFDDI